MFALAGLAAPIIGNVLGNVLNQATQGNQCGQSNNAQNAQEDFGNALQDFQQGNVGGGLQHVAEGLSHFQNPLGFI